MKGISITKCTITDSKGIFVEKPNAVMIKDCIFAGVTNTNGIELIKEE